jgi:hypothetical protein
LWHGCAQIAVGSTVRGAGIKEETREYGAFIEDITSLGAWLKKNGVKHVAMESTGDPEAGIQPAGGGC